MCYRVDFIIAPLRIRLLFHLSPDAKQDAAILLSVSGVVAKRLKVLSKLLHCPVAPSFWF